MPVKTNSFESIESLGKKAGQKVTQTVAVVGQDIAEQFGLKEMPKPEQQKIKSEEKQNTETIRKNIELMNRQITEIRKKRQQQPEEAKKEKKQTEQKKFFEQKKKESLLFKIIKSQKGTKEGVQRVGG